MKNQKYLVILLLSFVLFACKDNKQNNQPPNSEKKSSDKQMNVVGGWSKAEINEEVKSASTFALSELGSGSEIEEITEAKIQIVSGKNYDIVFTLKNGEEWNVIVYKNLKNEYSLTKSKNLTH